ncbi:hypothetical protein B0T18DRAFT_332286 [Schizothecium vesticola]|uniref:Uncharacterized protein n=1 Tax=Schizothecium vesticola TaxID=314040 RepID=A0AA40EIV3_9PEZI|nr:hypothetical protein B0T18DRAFT_332286 [Schizothecium vesticola]
MHTNQQREYDEATAYQNTKTKYKYRNRPWLGPLSRALSYKVLELINHEYKYALAALPTKAHQPTREVTDLPPYDDYSCTVGLQFGIPCRHKIYRLLVGNKTREEAPSRPRAGRLLSSSAPRRPTPEPREDPQGPREESPREESPQEGEAAVEAPAPAPKRRGRPPKNKETAPEQGPQAPPPQPKKRGRPPKNKETAAMAAPEPKPKRQRKTPGEAPPTAVGSVGIASQGVVGTKAAVGTTGQTTRSGRQVKLTEKAVGARKV